MTDLAVADYQNPSRTCDIVMKGGITSGVVYPHAVCELAKTYRFVNIGGTSAGAIASVAAAAAEHGRAHRGFEKLAALPAWVGEGTNLFDLFQPQRPTRRLFRILTAGLGTGGSSRIALAALRNFAAAAAIGALPGLVVLILAIALPGGAALKVVGILAGLLLALIGLVGGLLAGIAVTAPRAICENGFGLCSGMPGPAGRGEALTPWLAGLIDDLAGPNDDRPLTFGHLREKGIELVMVTTDITHRVRQRLPASSRELFFDPQEWRALFPEPIVQWLVEHPPPLGTKPARSKAIRDAMVPRLPLPADEDLPVVVGARMSLSFPLLISAVPLWGLDLSLRVNHRALEGEGAARPEQVWFSDGGISSNFPVHFFDAPLPRRPTFAIDLDGFHPDYPRQVDEAKNVYLPNRNLAGVLEPWHRFAPDPGPGRLFGFLEGIVRTMQNRVDSALARQPGYRDRIVHVHTESDEGGLNLSMPPPVITALTKRGRAGAELLVARFTADGATTRGLGWDNHRWIRYRSAVASISAQMTALQTAWTTMPEAGARTYAQLLERDSGALPSSYRFSVAQRSRAKEVTETLRQAGMQAARGPALAEGAPRPRPVSRLVPDD